MVTSAPLRIVANYFQTTAIVANEVTDHQTKVTDKRLFLNVCVVHLTSETDRYLRVLFLVCLFAFFFFVLRSQHISKYSTLGIILIINTK